MSGIRLICQDSYHIYNREIPFFLFGIPSGAYNLKEYLLPIGFIKNGFIKYNEKYEPLIDLEIIELRELYKKVKEL